MSPFFHQLHELLRVQRAVRLLHLEGKEQCYPDQDHQVEQGDHFAQKRHVDVQRIWEEHHPVFHHQEAQQLEQTRQQELQYTQGLQIRAIAQAADPILVAVYQERGCGLLLDRSAVYIANPAMDITDVVIQRLNAALPSLSFNRTPVPVQAPAQ